MLFYGQGADAPCGAISLIAPYGPHGAISEIRAYPHCGAKPRNAPSHVFTNYPPDARGGTNTTRSYFVSKN